MRYVGDYGVRQTKGTVLVPDAFTNIDRRVSPALWRRVVNRGDQEDRAKLDEYRLIARHIAVCNDRLHNMVHVERRRIIGSEFDEMKAVRSQTSGVTPKKPTPLFCRALASNAQ